jgi:cytochrome c553
MLLTVARLFAMLGVAAVAFSAIAFGQDSTQVTAGLATWKSAGCADCHGKFADGNPDDDDFPTGADLRTTRLDAAAMKQTIMCGRPGTDWRSALAPGCTKSLHL